MRGLTRLLLLFMALALPAGCGSSGGGGGGGSPTVVRSQLLIGDLNSYASLPGLTIPYRNGWKLALEEINAAGGVQGKPLRVVSRDDGGNPARALAVAAGLVSKQKVAMLMGTYASPVAQAVADFAGKKEILFLAGQPLDDALTWSRGNRFTFRIRTPVYAQAAMLARAAAKLPGKRWVTIAPNTGYGRSAVETFKKLLRAKRPDIKWVGEQWVESSRFDARATVDALFDMQPEGIFNATHGADLSTFLREAKIRLLFRERLVVSLLTGEPEHLDPLKRDIPVGWLVTGYPWYSIKTNEHLAFIKAYRAKFNTPPRMASIIGYTTMLAAASILRRSGSANTAQLITAAERTRIETPFGKVSFRRLDHQSTLGTYVGRTGVRGVRGVMENWAYADGGDYLPRGSRLRRLIRR